LVYSIDAPREVAIKKTWFNQLRRNDNEK